MSLGIWYANHMPRKFSLSLALAGLLCVAVRAQGIPVVSITFDGNSAVDPLRLKSYLRFCREGGLFQPAALEDDIRRLGACYEDMGFLHARVGPAAVRMENVAGRGQGAVIRIPIVEGPRFMMGEVSVRNAQALKSSTLIQMVPLRTGQPYSRGRMAEWRDKIVESYQTMGYIRFKAELREDVREVRRVVDCVLECTEGEAYRVRSIVVEGEPSINRPDFKRHLLVGEGGVYNPEMLVLSLHFINQMRVFNPISQSDVDVRIDDAAHAVDLVFRVVALKKPAPSM